jgi:hypothetical protein
MPERVWLDVASADLRRRNELQRSTMTGYFKP